jgi:hypothetical protein
MVYMKRALQSLPLKKAIVYGWPKTKAKSNATTEILYWNEQPLAHRLPVDCSTVHGLAHLQRDVGLVKPEMQVGLVYI